MVLAYQNVSRSQDKLAKQLKVQSALGTPTRNIQHLATKEINVIYEEGTLVHLERWLASGLPVIAFVQAGELSHWQGEVFQHAVAIIELDESTVWILDPDMDYHAIAIPVDEFMLAWLGMDYLYAVIAVLPNRANNPGNES
jgi:hypothetical protein